MMSKTTGSPALDGTKCGENKVHPKLFSSKCFILKCLYSIISMSYFASELPVKKISQPWWFSAGSILY